MKLLFTFFFTIIGLIGYIFNANGQLNLSSNNDAYKAAASECRKTAAITLCSDRKKFLLKMAEMYDCMAINSQRCEHLQPQGAVPACPADGTTGSVSKSSNNTQSQNLGNQSTNSGNGALMNVAGSLGSQIMQANDPKKAVETEKVAALTEQLAGQGVNGSVAGNAVRAIGGITTLFGKKKQNHEDKGNIGKSTEANREETSTPKNNEALKSEPILATESKKAIQEPPNNQDEQQVVQKQLPVSQEEEQAAIRERMKKRMEDYRKQQTDVQNVNQVNQTDRNQFSVNIPSSDAPSSQSKEVLLIRSYPNQTIPAIISYESDLVINYRTLDGQSASINKNEIVTILYPDGRRTDFRPAGEVNAFLQGADTAIRKWKFEKGFSPTIETSTPEGVSDKPTLSAEQYKEYRQKAIDQVIEFVDYLNIITDKTASASEKSKAVNQAIRLFSPDATIAVTSKNRQGIRRYPIHTYLNNLKLLPYQSANIEWHEVNYVKELTQAADGNYYGLISGQQTFTGYSSDGKILYSDVTEKNVRVKLQSYQKFVNGQSKVNWDVLLGNIGVAVVE